MTRTELAKVATARSEGRQAVEAFKALTTAAETAMQATPAPGDDLQRQAIAAAFCERYMVPLGEIAERLAEAFEVVDKAIAQSSRPTRPTTRRSWWKSWA